MGDLVTYRTLMTDSERWQRFEHRPGDIVISTPPKSGTTWTQMLCALMIFDGPDLPAPLDALSPWLDLRIRSEDEVFEVYDRQDHQRFIKTHTPLDGLPVRDDVFYIVVGRDPRDAMVSFEHHMDNLDLGVVLQSRQRAIGLDDLEDFGPRREDEPDPTVRFRNYVEADRDPGTLMSLANVLHHLDTGWERRDRPNVGMFHFLDYERDLVREMGRLAALCSIDVDTARLAELAPEAGIDRMRDRADEVAPDISSSDHWKDRSRFFRSAAAGEWLERTTPADRDLYDDRVGELVTDDLARWIHHGGSSI